MLLGCGFDVVAASGIAQRCRCSNARKPDVVIIDTFGKEKNDGLAEARWLSRWIPTVPVIIVTRHTSEERILACGQGSVIISNGLVLIKSCWQASIDIFPATEKSRPKTPRIIP